MQLATILTIFGLAASASAGCYSGGATGDHEFGFEQLDGVCTQFINQGAFSANEERTACRGQSDDAYKWDFAVTHISSGSRVLGLDECKNGLYKEINGCTYGGDSSYTNWEYKSDPNAGTC